MNTRPWRVEFRHYSWQPDEWVYVSSSQTLEAALTVARREGRWGFRVRVVNRETGKVHAFLCCGLHDDTCGDQDVCCEACPAVTR